MSHHERRSEQFFRSGRFRITELGYAALQEFGLTRADVGEEQDSVDCAVSLLVGQMSAAEFDTSPLLIEVEETHSPQRTSVSK